MHDPNIDPIDLVDLIVVPYDVERADTGAARGPRALLEHGFAARLEELGASVHVAEIVLHDGYVARAGGKTACVVELGRAVAQAVAVARSRRRFPLIVAGGCLPAVGAVAGLQRSGRELQIVWIDAHGDFNTPESSPSGYWDGMALATVCGRSLPAVFKTIGLLPIHCRNVMHLAGRAFDPLEVEELRRLDLDVVAPGQVGAAETRRRLERQLHDRKDIYLHVDVDGIDPHDAPAVSFPEPDGVPLGDLLGLIESMAKLGQPAAMTLSALNFERGRFPGVAGSQDSAAAAGAQRTVDACVALVAPFLRR